MTGVMSDLAPLQAVGQPWILYDASMGFPGRKSIVRVAYKSFFSGPDQITKEDIQNRCGSRIKEAFQNLLHARYISKGLLDYSSKHSLAPFAYKRHVSHD